MKPPFKADSSDVILCPNLGRKVSVDSYCHGWALRDELCHDAEACEPYKEYAERKLRRRKIRLPPELFTKLQERAKAERLTPEEYVEDVILKKCERR